MNGSTKQHKVLNGDFSVFSVKEQKTKIKLKVNVQRGGQNALLCGYYLRKKR